MCLLNSIIGMLIRKRLQQDTPQSDRRARKQEVAVSHAAAKAVSASEAVPVFEQLSDADTGGISGRYLYITYFMILE